MKAKTVLKAILPFVALGIGVAVFALLIKTKPEAAKASVTKRSPLVTVIEAQPSQEKPLILGQGTVMAAQQIVLQPQVTGTLKEVDPALTPGGYFKKDQTIAKIDARDYRWNLAQQQAQVERARFELEVESSRRTVAQKEWALLGQDLPSTENGKSVALRQPHERNAKANLRAAQSALAQARQNVQRTTLAAPFNALVLDEAADEGQLVTPQTRVATLVGTDTFHIQVNVPVEKLGTFALPGVTPGATTGAKAIIKQDIGTDGITREGTILRLLASLDPVGRMARIIVEVKDPLQLEAGGGLPLLLGAYVQVEIEGNPLQDVTTIPRRALRANNQAWTVTSDNTLNIKPVTVAWSYEDRLLVRGLAPGDRVITGRLATPVQGMGLRVAGTPSAKAPARKQETQEGQP